MVVKGDGTSRAFTGTITGSVGLLHANASGTAATWTLSQNSNYSGPTYLAGGTVSLVNAGIAFRDQQPDRRGRLDPR